MGNLEGRGGEGEGETRESGMEVCKEGRREGQRLKRERWRERGRGGGRKNTTVMIHRLALAHIHVHVALENGRQYRVECLPLAGRVFCWD